MVDEFELIIKMNALWMASLTLASAHILLALAFTLAFSTIEAPNFSIGTIMTFGAYQSFILSRIMNLPVYLNLPLSIITGFLINSIIYLTIIKPLTCRNSSKIMLTIATMGLSIALTGVLQVIVYWLRETYEIYSFVFLLKAYDYNIWGIPGVFLTSSILCFFVYFSLRYYFKHTRIGIGHKAIQENLELAQIQGIDIQKTWLLVWGFSGSLSCLAGSLIPLWFSFTVTSGTLMITPIIAASLLGGISSTRGFFLGGLITGVLEIMITTVGMARFGNWVGEYRPIIPMIIIVLVLYFKPEGLLGSQNRYEKLLT